MSLRWPLLPVDTTSGDPEAGPPGCGEDKQANRFVRKSQGLPCTLDAR